MTIETAAVSSRVVAEYDAIPSVFEVRSILTARRSDGGHDRYVLSERIVASPYVKDYDAVSERPREWPERFDTSSWEVFLARVGTRAVAGAAVAVRTRGLDLLEGRDDLALLWDIRVAPDVRRHGVGRALFQAAEQWALTQDCCELKIETQDVNVAACRFYAAMGCELRTVRKRAYTVCPGEAQYLWYKRLLRLQS